MANVGRPRKRDPRRTIRVLTKFDKSEVNTLDIVVAYLKHTSPNPTLIDRSSVVKDAVMEYLTKHHASVVEMAVTWYRKEGRYIDG